MNPIDMQGPEFLQFYLIYGIAALVGFRILRTLWIHSRLPSASTRWSPGVYPREGDGYPIAFLRGGEKEVADALLGRLVAAGRIALDGMSLRRGHAPLDGPRLISLEQAAMAALPDGTPAAGASPLLQKALGSSIAPIRDDLERNGLLVSDEQRKGLRPFTALAFLAIPGLGLVKLAIALDRGRTNVGFLILLILLYAFLTWRVMKAPRQTPAGRKYLAWLQSSHKELVNRVAQNRRSEGELVLLMGIFGVAALPTLPYMHDLRRAMQPMSSSSGDSGSSSSDGGGDGGGGGCGGGGCGGCGGGGD
ncbi:MAG TPA: TIGR04222 domain-containing membrane protein [Thermoanaerobaculia bacterium]|nr:TIGR04222 domain-containing membrane protein [Thermoanaerobaculia bacterium]